MLNRFTLFLLLFIVWFLSLLITGNLTLLWIIIGFFASVLITIFAFRLSIITNNTEFLFLQFGFYSYIFGKLNKNISNLFKICFQFLNPNTKYTSILDYVFLNKDSDSESVLTANLLTLLPGTIGVLMKKRYLIVHSIDKEYFSLVEMYNITNEIGKIDDDSLV